MTSDAIEVDPSEISSAAPALADVLTSPFVSGAYPSQNNTFIPGYAGEYRGTYGDQWKPSYSFFGAPRPNGKTHGGIDIYCPVGTPLVAVVDGELTQVSKDDKNAMGNRVWITFSQDGQQWTLVYGHLSSFDGAPRSVTKGDTIGASGCTGDADYDGTCTGQNRCGMSSSHVHLQLVSVADGTKVDAAQSFGWNIRYQDDNRVVPCEQAFQAPAQPESA
jgi:murein DD-endopeptidase MepM/ murein hydrolase activator NlpD